MARRATPVISAAPTVLIASLAHWNPNVSLVASDFSAGDICAFAKSLDAASTKVRASSKLRPPHSGSSISILIARKPNGREGTHLEF